MEKAINKIVNWIYKFIRSCKQPVLCGLFSCLKKFLNFFGFNLANHTCRSLYGAERGITTFHVVTERGWDWWNRLTSRKQFNAVLKVVWRKVVRHVVKDYQKKLKRRQKGETLFCELPEIVVENLAVWDDYDTDYTIFNVCGSDIRICDDELAEALKHLSERNRENLLMYYFLEMSDTEIAKRQNISRSGVFQNRHNSLELMKKILKEKW